MTTPNTFSALPRETAEALPREIAERTFTEAEHDAIVASRVAQETAALTEANEALTGRVETLTSEKAAAEEKLELMEAAKEKAEQDLADTVAKAEEAARREVLKVERAEQVKAAANVPATFITPEKAARWAALPEEEFASYLTDLTDAVGAAVVKPTVEVASTVTGAPLGEPTTPKKASAAFFASI